MKITIDSKLSNKMLAVADPYILLQLKKDATLGDYLNQYEVETGEPMSCSRLFDFIEPNLHDVIYKISGEHQSIHGYYDCNWADFSTDSVCGKSCIKLAKKAAELVPMLEENEVTELWEIVLTQIGTICLG